MTKVFIASRVGAKTKKQFEKNLKRYRAFARMAILQGYDAEATGPYYCMLLNDFSQEERELGMKLGIARLLRCQQIWLLENEDGSLSEGMKREWKAATKHNRNKPCGSEKEIAVVFFSPKNVEGWLKANDPFGYELWLKSK